MANIPRSDWSELIIPAVEFDAKILLIFCFYKPFSVGGVRVLGVRDGSSVRDKGDSLREAKE